MSGSVKILPYSEALKPWFDSLNRAWLEKYFFVEELDNKVLTAPDTEVIAKGGVIIFAELNGEIVGTCALKKQNEGEYELTKMAVTPSAQGKGIGRVLLEGAIAQYKKLPGKLLYLESHHSLGAALKLYETGGFEHAERPPGPVAYVRSDVYMIYPE